MNTMDYILLGFSAFFLIHTIIFLLYQFEVLDISENSMVRWIRFLNILETIILVLTRFIAFGTWGKFALATFYILNIITLILQFILAEFGFGQKILDIFWILFYVFLFLLDITNISFMQIIDNFKNIEPLVNIDTFLRDSFLGKLIIAIVAPTIRTLLLEAIRKNK